MKRIFLIILLLGLLIDTSWAKDYSVYIKDRAAVGLAPEIKDSPTYVPGEVLVKFKRGISTRRAMSVHGVMGAKSANEFSPDLYKVRITTPATVEQMINQYKQNPDVEYAQPNYYYYASGFSSPPNDPGFNVLWGLHNTGQTVKTKNGTVDDDMDVLEAWDISKGEQNRVTVAVLDTGALLNHPDLSPNLLSNGTDTINSDNDPTDGDGHGTHVSGTIAAAMNNLIGSTGVNPNAKIIPIKVLGDDGKGTSESIVAGINYAVANNAKIMNMSLGGAGFDAAQYAAINNAKNSGVLLVAAAGNESTNNEVEHKYPSDFDLPNILSVAATDQDDDLASFSNYGAVSVDVAGPGVNIYSTSIYGFQNNFNDETVGSLPLGWKQIGTAANWQVTDEIFGISKNALTDSRGANYSNTTDTIIYYDSLIAYQNDPVDTLSFFLITDLGDAVDHLDVVYSKDKKTWVSAATYNGEGVTLGTRTLDLGAIFRENKNLYLGFRFTTDDNTTGVGVYIDNVKFQGGGGSYEYLQGTSMATPNVTGVASLIWSLKPTLTYAEVKDIIMSSVDKRDSLTGKCVTGGRVNAYNALKLIPGITIVEQGNSDVRAGDKGYLEPEAGKNATIQFHTAGSGRAEVNIYTLSGTLVYTTSVDSTGTAQQTATWDGRTNSGELVASGNYLIHIKGPGINEKKKITVIK